MVRYAGSFSRGVRASVSDDVGPPLASGSGVSPSRPLLLRSDVPWTLEGSARRALLVKGAP